MSWILHKLHNDLHFLRQRIKIEKTEKLVAKLYDKTQYIIYIINLEQVLKWLNLIKMLD